VTVCHNGCPGYFPAGTIAGYRACRELDGQIVEIQPDAGHGLAGFQHNLTARKLIGMSASGFTSDSAKEFQTAATPDIAEIRAEVAAFVVDLVARGACALS
jgi:hypothetical protein